MKKLSLYVLSILCQVNASPDLELTLLAGTLNTTLKENMINKQLKALYDAIMKKGGPRGPITQSIVDEYHKMVREESEPELETKKIRISFLKKGKTNG